MGIDLSLPTPADTLDLRVVGPSGLFLGAGTVEAAVLESGNVGLLTGDRGLGAKAGLGGSLGLSGLTGAAGVCCWG